MVSWSFLGDKWTGECSNLMNTVLRDEWGFREWRLQTSSKQWSWIYECRLQLWQME